MTTYRGRHRDPIAELLGAAVVFLVLCAAAVPVGVLLAVVLMLSGAVKR